MNTLMTEDSNVLIYGNYTYSEGWMELNDAGTTEEFEINDNGTDYRVGYRQITKGV